MSAAVYDRMSRIAMGYQSAEEEVAITAREAGASRGELTEKVVELCRLTREHPEIRIGSSVRGGIDTLMIASQLSQIRGSGDADTLLDAALTALSGRIRVHEGSPRTAEEVILELFLSIFGEQADGGDGPAGKGGTPAGATAA